METITSPPRSPETSIHQVKRDRRLTADETETGSFGEYFIRANELLRNFAAATRLPVRLVVAGAVFEMPPSQYDACLQARGLSDTAVECLRFHKQFHTAGDGAAPLCLSLIHI